MPVLENWDLTVSTEQVLRAQGVDPHETMAKRPFLVQTAELAINRGKHLLRPKVLYEKYSVKRFIHEKIELYGDYQGLERFHLTGPLIVEHLAQANEVILLICTIGGELESTVSSMFSRDPVIALALDAVGSAAVELLAIKACNYFEENAIRDGLRTSMPLNPGMVGWPVEVGQPQIFTLLDSEEIQVSMTDSYMMIPSKSLSIALGIGKEFSKARNTCEYCSLKGVCRYQDHYAEQN